MGHNWLSKKLLFHCDNLQQFSVFGSPGFCAKMSASISAQTIRVYLAGIRLLHIENGFPDPTQGAQLLHYLCTAICREQGERQYSHFPITIPLRHRLKAQLASHASIRGHDKLLFWAAFTLAFYGFLRASEFTAPTGSTFDPSTHLAPTDIRFS